MTDSIMRKIDGSSNIVGAGFDENTSTMIIVFISGAQYVYDDVPADVFDNFMAAKSPGRFFIAHIRNKFAATKVPEPPREPMNAPMKVCYPEKG